MKIDKKVQRNVNHAITVFGVMVLLLSTVSAATITGSGTSGKIAKFTGTDTIGDSVITESGGNIGIGTSNPAGIFHVTPGRSFFTANNEQYSIALRYSDLFAPNGQFYIGATNSNTPDLIFSGNGGTEIMRIKDDGNVKIGIVSPKKLTVVGSFEAGENFDTAVDNMYDFKYNHPTKKLYTRSLIIAEANDTSEIALRRANGTTTAPTAMLTNELVGLLYFQPFGTNGAFDTGISPFYGRTALISSRVLETPTSTTRGGNLIFGVTKKGETLTRERMYLNDEGKLMILGRGAVEDNNIQSITTDFQPKGYLTILGPNTSVDPTLSLRQANAPAYGYDFDLESASVGRLDLYRVVNSTRTQVLSILRDSGNVGIGTTAPDAAALLEINSTTKGFLPPRMTTTQRGAISTPPEGLMIYNTSTKKLNFYDGSAWKVVTSN